MKLFKKLFMSSLSSIYDDVLNVCDNRAVSIKNQFDKNFLDAIIVPKDITTIGALCFGNCKYTKKILLSKHLKKIEALAFYRCENLTKIKIPEGLNFIGDGAFSDCSCLSHIDLPNSIVHLGKNCFDKCSNLNSVKLPKYADNLGNCWPGQLCYISKVGDDFYFKDTETKGSVFVAQPYFVKYVIKHFDDPNLSNTMKLLNSLPDEVVKFFYDNATNKNEISFIDSILNSNMKRYDSLRSKIIYDISTMTPFVKLCSLLGVLEKSPIKSERISKRGNKVVDVIDYSQKASEFLIQLVKTGKLNLVIAEQINSNLEKFDFNPQVAEFVFKNYDELMKQSPLFFAECLNRFDAVQKAHTSNKGGCKQLAPTVAFFKNYFDKNKFGGVDDENKHTAHVIGMYYNNQSTFDRADEIVKTHYQKSIPDNILNEDFSEKIFKRAKKRIKNIETVSKSTLSDLCDATEKFSYELLRKDDVLNLVLGKLCNCCSHIEGVGDGIAVASMLHPSVQNIVIKNRDGEIVAKSTMFVNQKQGYAVCNTIKVSSAIRYDESEDVYLKLKEAISDFATQYNKEFTPKLKVINVGMGFNDVSSFIKKYDKKSKEILYPLNYSMYSRKKQYGYEGDALKEQFTIWQDNEK